LMSATIALPMAILVMFRARMSRVRLHLCVHVCTHNAIRNL
jgi:hypothetical protein